MGNQLKYAHIALSGSAGLCAEYRTARTSGWQVVSTVAFIV
jgi:hypothetical protein